MKRNVIYLLWICFTGLIFASGKTTEGKELDFAVLESLRIKYYSAVEDEDFLPELENYIEKIFNSPETKANPLYLAYKGGVAAVKSKHAFWPHKKLSNLNTAMDFLEKAIALEKENLEIRFMRFSILHYVPGFLGYSSERAEDARIIAKLLLKKDYSSIDEKVQKGIAEFMLRSDRLTEEETSDFKKNLLFLTSK